MSLQYLVNEGDLIGINEDLLAIYNRLERMLEKPVSPDSNVFTQATLKKVEDERSGNIRRYLLYSDSNSANKELWHVALRCEISHEEEWKVWHYLKSGQDAILPWRVTKNNNGGYVYCQKCRPAPSSYLCAC